MEVEDRIRRDNPSARLSLGAQVICRVDPALLERVKAKAAAEDMTVSQVLRRAMRAYVEYPL